MESRIYAFLRDNPEGLLTRDLLERVYADLAWHRGRKHVDVDGGPLTAGNAIQVHVNRANKKLAPLGLRLQGCNRRHRSSYKLVRL